MLMLLQFLLFAFIFALEDLEFLKDIRETIDVVPYTPGQRLEVARSIKKMFQVPNID